MNASKENAQKAAELFDKIKFEDCSTSFEDDQKQNENLSFIQEFIEAARKRLPTEAAIAKDKSRRKAKV